MSKSHFLCKKSHFLCQKSHFLGQKSVFSAYALPEEVYLTYMEDSDMPSLRTASTSTLYVEYRMMLSLVENPAFSTKFELAYTK